MSPPSGERAAPLLAPELVQKILRSALHSCRAATRSPKVVPGQGEGRRSEGGGGDVADKVFKVFSQDRFCSVLRSRSSTKTGFKIFSQDGKWVHQRFVEQIHDVAWRGSGDAVLRREEAHEVLWKPGH